MDPSHLRPASPLETFTILKELIVDGPRVVLDVGCGTGNIARPLADSGERIDAVDLSLPMLERARMLPRGDSPKIRWLHERAKDVELEPPYALYSWVWANQAGGGECRQIFFGRGDGELFSIAVDLARFFRTLLGENALPIRGAQTHTRRAIHTVVAPE